ncbi:2-phosphosulfolactate phosphatase [Thermanaerovibrio acidaminovorans]|uniref:2-phosphosulfolactate phosphatase n=1 Tax=Thermanaerovibrio acidaminovorans TaxID=81462 RepID=UPI0001A3CFCC|nr:2-phosphosulfolactate phosphatase [Thermanaerovibrio acidaminovorans]
MSLRVELFPVPSRVEGIFEGCFVVDMLRATTQISVLLEMGCREIRLVSRVEDARALRGALGDTWALLGERGGVPPEGFDGGNSPWEVLSAGEAPLRVVMCTTNGTGALVRALEVGARAYPFCMRNLSAAALRVLSHRGSVAVVCAGHEGESSYEDLVCAGGLLDRVIRLDPLVELSDRARGALELYRSVAGDVRGAILEGSSHARYLVELGFGADLDVACLVDATEVVCPAEAAEWGGVIRR